MKKRMLAYLAYMDGILDHSIPIKSAFSTDGQHETSAQKDYFPTRKEYEKLLEHHLEQISFFQHERLIHLIVLALFTILTFIAFFVCITNFNYGYLALFIVLLILLIPYIKHYYLLENGVQKMYAQYDALVKLLL